MIAQVVGGGSPGDPTIDRVDTHRLRTDDDRVVDRMAIGVLRFDVVLVRSVDVSFGDWVADERRRLVQLGQKNQVVGERYAERIVEGGLDRAGDLAGRKPIAGHNVAEVIVRQPVRRHTRGLADRDGWIADIGHGDQQRRAHRVLPHVAHSEQRVQQICLLVQRPAAILGLETGRDVRQPVEFRERHGHRPSRLVPLFAFGPQIDPVDEDAISDCRSAPDPLDPIPRSVAHGHGLVLDLPEMPAQQQLGDLEVRVLRVVYRRVDLANDLAAPANAAAAVAGLPPADDVLALRGDCHTRIAVQILCRAIDQDIVAERPDLGIETAGEHGPAVESHGMTTPDNDEVAVRLDGHRRPKPADRRHRIDSDFVAQRYAAGRKPLSEHVPVVRVRALDAPCNDRIAIGIGRRVRLGLLIRPLGQQPIDHPVHREWYCATGVASGFAFRAESSNRRLWLGKICGVAVSAAICGVAVSAAKSRRDACTTTNT